MPITDRFVAEGSLLLVVDVQGTLMAKIEGRDGVLAAILRAIRGAAILGIPVVATEQYPRGLGPSLPEIVDLVPDRPSKTLFHAGDVAEVAGPIASGAARRVTIVGIEAHVCVAQTALELLGRGVSVQVLADAVSSRHASDREVALRRLERAGVAVSTVEAALFEWAGDAGHPGFKGISALVKEADRDRAAEGRTGVPRPG